jgi:UDP-3-O-[3-hydroxymyristoyl] N-acetylglucosamine deacetylase
MVAVGGQHRLHVVEHLFSALYGLNLFDVRIDVYGDEVPFFDGSSSDFVFAVNGLKNQGYRAMRLGREISVRRGDSYIHYTPRETDDLTIEMSLTHQYIGNQRIVLEINPNSYEKEIAPARTFVFTDDNDPRLQQLPPYGIGITGSRMYAAAPLRFPDEPVRHKLLDLLGDMYVLKKKIYGKISGNNTSHELNFRFVHKLASAMSDIDDKQP